jgi:hypothetical protein
MKSLTRSRNSSVSSPDLIPLPVIFFTPLLSALSYIPDTFLVLYVYAAAKIAIRVSLTAGSLGVRHFAGSAVFLCLRKMKFPPKKYSQKTQNPTLFTTPIDKIFQQTL